MTRCWLWKQNRHGFQDGDVKLEWWWSVGCALIAMGEWLARPGDRFPHTAELKVFLGRHVDFGE